MGVNMKNKKTGIFLAVTAAALWGIMGIFVRIAKDGGMGPVEISFFRCAIAGTFFYLFLRKQNPDALKINKTGLITCMLYGILAYSISFISYSISVSRIPVAVATILMYLCPIWVILLNAVIFHDKPTLNKIISVMICLAGALCAVDIFSIGYIHLDGFGILMGLINGFGAALQILIPRYFSKQYSKDTMLVYGFLGAAIFLAFFTNFTNIGTVFVSPGGIQPLCSVLVLGVLCTMIANVFYVKSSEYISTSETSILGALEVAVGGMAGFLFYHENLKVIQLVGILLVIGGAIISQRTKIA